MKKCFTINLLLLLTIMFSAVSYGTTNVSNIALTKEEQQWIDQHPVIRLGADPDWPPFDFVDEQGVHQGIAADFLHILSQQLGLNVELVPHLTWNQVQEGAKNRSLDLVSLSQETPERKTYLNYTDTATSVPWAIVAKKEFKTMTSLKDLSGLKVAMVKGYAIIEIIQKEYPEIDIYEVDSSLQGLRAVATGKASAMIEGLAVSSFLISDNNLVNLKITVDSDLDIINLKFAVRSDWPQLVSILNKALRNISREEVQAINSRWVVIEAAESTSQDDGSVIAGWLIWTAAAVFLLLAFAAWLLMRFTTGEKLATHIGSARFRVIVLMSLSIFVAIVILIGLFFLSRETFNLDG